MATATAARPAKRSAARKVNARVPTPAPPTPPVGRRRWSATPDDRAPQPWSVQFHSPHGDLLALSYVFVTPEMATELLAANEGNRLLSERLVEQYVRSALAQDWEFTADPVQEGPSRELFNGQHRMEMIKRSGVGQWMIMVEGLPERARQYFDIGRRRTAADMLRMRGFETPRVLAATSRVVLLWEHWRTHHTAVTPGVNEVTEYAVTAEGAIRKGWETALAISDTVGGGVSVPALAAAYMRAMEVADAFTVAHFFDRIAYNNGLSRGEPAWALHKRFVAEMRTSVVETLWFTVHAWNLEMEGKGSGGLAMPRNGISAPQMPDMLEPVPEDVSPEREEALAWQESQELAAANGGQP